MAPSIPIEQKIALQDWARAQNPKPTLLTCIEWFQNEFNRKLPPSSISLIMHADFGRQRAILSKPKKKGDKSLKVRDRGGKWGILELVLLEWQKGMERQGQTVSGNQLKDEGRRIWEEIKSTYYPGQEAPPFSNGWLDRYKQRHNLHTVAYKKGPGGSGSVPLDVEQLRPVQLEVQPTHQNSQAKKKDTMPYDNLRFKLYRYFPEKNRMV